MAREVNRGEIWGYRFSPTSLRRREEGVRLLHLADRLSDRGGAYRHLPGLLEELGSAHDLLLAVGADEGQDHRYFCPSHPLGPIGVGSWRTSSACIGAFL